MLYIYNALHLQCSEVTFGLARNLGSFRWSPPRPPTRLGLAAHVPLLIPLRALAAITCVEVPLSLCPARTRPLGTDLSCPDVADGLRRQVKNAGDNHASACCRLIHGSGAAGLLGAQRVDAQKLLARHPLAVDEHAVGLWQRACACRALMRENRRYGGALGM